MRRTAGRDVLPLLVVVLAVLALGPALLPGYTLIGDQVFVPDQSLLPVDGRPRRGTAQVGAPGRRRGRAHRSRPRLGLGVGGAAGRARAAGHRRGPAAARGAARPPAAWPRSVAVWSPYVAERLLLGHWSLLLAVAALPWALAAADDARRGQRAGPAARWLLWLAPGLADPDGRAARARGVGSGAAVAGRRSRAGAVPLVVLAGAALQLPWVVPSVLHPAAVGAAGVDVFALRAEGPWGSLLTALGTGGVWNADAVPGSRATVLAPVATLVLLALAVAGRRAVVELLGRPVARARSRWRPRWVSSWR